MGNPMNDEFNRLLDELKGKTPGQQLTFLFVFFGSLKVGFQHNMTKKSDILSDMQTAMNTIQLQDKGEKQS